MDKKKGFTLVELLLVVGILGLLISVVVVAAGQFAEGAKRKAMHASLKSVKTAMEVYYVSYGAFPTTANWTDTTVTNCELISPTGTASARLIDTIPYDIYRGNGKTNYVTYLLYTGSGKATYVVRSYGADGALDITAAGDDVITGGPDDDIFITNARGRTYTE